MDTRAVSGDDWRLTVPSGMLEAPARDTQDVKVIRGWIAGDAPATVVVTTRPRAGTTLRKAARALAGHDGSAVDVAGAQGARRVDRRERVEEGLDHDYDERQAIVIAARRRALITLIVLTREDDDVTAEVEAIVASFAV